MPSTEKISMTFEIRLVPSVRTISQYEGVGDGLGLREALNSEAVKCAEEMVRRQQSRNLQDEAAFPTTLDEV